jgi:hypothetical protein
VALRLGREDSLVTALIPALADRIKLSKSMPNVRFECKRNFVLFNRILRREFFCRCSGSPLPVCRLIFCRYASAMPAHICRYAGSSMPVCRIIFAGTPAYLCRYTGSFSADNPGSSLPVCAGSSPPIFRRLGHLGVAVRGKFFGTKSVNIQRSPIFMRG